jgi:hypothetical protein
MKVSCEPAGMFCTVHTMFDFMAANAKRSRRTQGVAALQLVMTFAGERPLIVAENSMVLGRERVGRNLAQEGASHD